MNGHHICMYMKNGFYVFFFFFIQKIHAWIKLFYFPNSILNPQPKKNRREKYNAEWQEIYLLRVSNRTWINLLHFKLCAMGNVCACAYVVHVCECGKILIYSIAWYFGVSIECTRTGTGPQNECSEIQPLMPTVTGQVWGERVARKMKIFLNMSIVHYLAQLKLIWGSISLQLLRRAKWYLRR